MNVFAKLSEMITEIGYEPISQSQTSKATYTLHTAIRDLCNMAKRETKQLKTGTPVKSTRPQEVHIIADDADVSFWDFLVLREYLRKITELVDAEVALVVGKPTHFAAWDHDSSRSKTDVLKLLNALSKKHPVLPDPPRATSRPQAREMVAKGKIEAAIANTLAVMVGNGMHYGDLLEKIASKPSSNEDLLVDLDSYLDKRECDRLTYDNKSLVPRNLVQAYLRFKDNTDTGTDRNPSLAKFLASMSTTNNFAGNSDEMLIKRLNAS